MMHKIYIIIFILISIIKLGSDDIYVISTGPADDAEVIITKLIISKAYNLLGIDPKFDHHPWARSLELSSSGDTDAELHRVKNISSKYKNLLIVNEPVLNVDFVAFGYKKHDIKITNWADLKTYSFAYVRGIKIIESNIQGDNFYIVKDIKAAFALLNLGRVDLVIDTHLNCLKEIQQSNYKDFEVKSVPLKRIPLYHYVHKKNKDLIPLLELAIKDVKKDID